MNISAQENISENKSKLQFLTLVLVFFFWGFVAASNDVLIPVFKEHLHLEQWQSQMISFAFYVAYTIGSVAYVFISKWIKGDLLNKIGYKNGIALGLVISAFGTLLFYPAAENESFLTMIVGLFIVGLGFSLQQTAANPLVIVLGGSNKGAQRLSLAGGVNNLGTTIGPVILAYFIFGVVGNQHTEASIASIKIPYLILGIAFLIVALFFKRSDLPNQIEHITNEEDNQTIETSKTSALEYPQLYLGMLAIFLYVGVEVSTASNLPEFIREKLNYPTSHIGSFVSLYWASLMIGRWTSSVNIFSLNKVYVNLLKIVVPYLAFMLFLLMNYVATKQDVTPFLIYGWVILLVLLPEFLSNGNPAKQLLVASFLGMIALLVGVFSTNYELSTFAFISVGLFCATLWPCIYTLAITGLGVHTNQGSSYLIMMIMGGGIISVFQGFLASPQLLGIQFSYFVGVFCFAYLAVYALYAIRGKFSN